MDHALSDDQISSLTSYPGRISITNPGDGSNLRSRSACCRSVGDVGFCLALCTQQHTEFTVLSRSLGVLMVRAENSTTPVSLCPLRAARQTTLSSAQAHARDDV